MSSEARVLVCRWTTLPTDTDNSERFGTTGTTPGRPGLRRGLPGFRGDASLRTWLFRIVMRLAAEPARPARRSGAVALDPEIPDTIGPAPDAAVLGRELRDRLEEAMERLPTRQRSALHLRAAEGLDYERIGRVLECSAGAARMLVLEARRRIIARMGGYLDP